MAVVHAEQNGENTGKQRRQKDTHPDETQAMPLWPFCLPQKLTHRSRSVLGPRLEHRRDDRA
jgi:hypothetical protein